MKRRINKRRVRKPAYKKRRNVKRRRIRRVRRRLGVSAAPGFSGFPANKIVRLRYAERIPMSPTGPATFTWHNMRANSVFDPNQTGSGHQPMGFDQWAGFYNHYVVVGSKITVKWISEAPLSSETNAMIVGVKLTDDTTPILSGGQAWDNISERGFSKRIMIMNDQNVKPVTTIAKFSPKKFFNIANVKDNVLRIGAPVTSNPTEEAIFQLWFCSANDTVVSAYIIQAFVTIDYLVLFSEPKDIAQS